MPRSEDNNPTERITRMLIEYDYLLKYASNNRRVMIEEGLHPEPLPFCRAMEMEKMYQHRFQRQTLANRKSVRRMRLRQSEGHNIRGRAQYNSSMDTSIERTIHQDPQFEASRLTSGIAHQSGIKPKPDFDTSIPEFSTTTEDSQGGISDKARADLERLIREGNI